MPVCSIYHSIREGYTRPVWNGPLEAEGRGFVCTRCARTDVPLMYIESVSICRSCLENPIMCRHCRDMFIMVYNVVSEVSPICRNCYRNRVRCAQCEVSFVNLPPVDFIGGHIVCPTCSIGGVTRCLRCFRGVINSKSNYCMFCDRPQPKETECKEIRILRPAGLELEFLSHPIPDANLFKEMGRIHGDGSVKLNGGHCEGKADLDRSYPYELSLSPETGDRFSFVVKHVTEVLKTKYYGWTNDTCGTHLHIYVADLSETERRTLASWWRVHEYMMFRVLPQHRIKSTYARPVANIDYHSWASQRYSSLNLRAFEEHGTYEYRLHDGTLNAQRLINWTNLLLYFTEGYRSLPITDEQAWAMVRGPKRPLMARFCKDTGLPLSLRKFILASAQKHYTRRCGLFRNGTDSVPPGADETSRSSISMEERIRQHVAMQPRIVAELGEDMRVMYIHHTTT